MKLILRKPNPGMGAREMVNIRVAAESRADADELCRKLQEEGGACAVLKNYRPGESDGRKLQEEGGACAVLKN